MKKFVFLYNWGGTEKPTKEGMDAWMNWFKTIGENMVDIGTPLGGGKEVSSNGAKDITPEMGLVGGYSIVNAADMDSAIEFAKGCPGKDGIRVYESLPM